MVDDDLYKKLSIVDLNVAVKLYQKLPKFQMFVD